MNNIGAAPQTFTAICQQFAESNVDPDRHIRFSEAKGLYAKDTTASLGNVKAAFGFRQQLQERDEKRMQGVQYLKQAIDTEYRSPGLGDRVFSTAGLDPNASVRVGDLRLLRDAISSMNVPRAPVSMLRDLV